MAHYIENDGKMTRLMAHNGTCIAEVPSSEVTPAIFEQMKVLVPGADVPTLAYILGYKRGYTAGVKSMCPRFVIPPSPTEDEFAEAVKEIKPVRETEREITADMLINMPAKDSIKHLRYRRYLPKEHYGTVVRYLIHHPDAIMIIAERLGITEDELNAVKEPDARGPFYLPDPEKDTSPYEFEDNKVLHIIG